MTREFSFVYDYGQVYLYDASAVGSLDVLAALDDSTRGAGEIDVSPGRTGACWSGRGFPPSGE